MPRHIKGALEAASIALDKANASLEHTLKELADSDRRAAIVAEAQAEVSETPGWLDEINDLIKTDSSPR